MHEKIPQGRIKVVQTSLSCLEWIYTWPKTEGFENEDARLILNLAIVWHYIEHQHIKFNTWNIDAADAVIPCWMEIDSNFILDSEVKNYSNVMLKSILENFWKTNMQIQMIRKYEKMLNKAAVDIESATIAGFLKTSMVTTTIRPELLSFNGFTRKVPATHFACTVFIVIRSKATSEDVSNYFTMKSYLENKVNILYCNIVLQFKIKVLNTPLKTSYIYSI